MIRLNRLASGILRPVRPLAEGRTYTQAIDLALDPFIGLAYSLVFGFLLLLGLALAATVVGLPVLGEVVMITRAAMGLERARARALLGVAVDAPPSPSMPVGWWSRIKAMLGDRTGWRAVGYTFVLPFSGILGFTAAAIWAGGIAVLLYPVWRWLWPVQAGSYGALTGVGYLVGISAAGLVLTIAGAWIVRAAARVDATLVRGRLGPSPADLSRRMDALKASRAAAVNQAAQERRRIERDLHDGVQARLVALAMDLGMARQRIESGEQPEAAAGLITQAHEEAIRAVTDLRDLARGVHPAVLTHRGLDAALSALIARSPVPVEVDVSLPQRPPPVLETIAYFVIAEALTNIVKHSQANHATVAVHSAGNMVIVEVTDDGIGGALPPGQTDEGLRAALDLHRSHPALALLILSQYVEETYAAQLLAEATERIGYLLKQRVARVSEFLDAVRRVGEGGTALGPEVVAQLVARRRTGRFGELTPREQEVLALMAEGHSNAAVAARLVITGGAVEKHISNVFSKLGLHDSGGQHRRVLAVLTYLRRNSDAYNAEQPRQPSGPR